MSPARSHCPLADVFGGIAGVIAALRPRRTICISCFHLRCEAFVDICCPLRRDAMSAAYCKLRATDGCGRPSAVQTRVRFTMPWHAGLGFPFGNGMFFVQQRLVLHLLELPLHWRMPQTSRAAMRPGTEAVVKRSAALDCASVSPRGSVVAPWSASVNPPRRAWTHEQRPRVASAVQISLCSSWGSKNAPHSRHLPSPNLVYTLTTKSRGARTLPAHASKWHSHL